MTTKMQPGDYVLKSDIPDEETLNRIREAVGYDGYFGLWNSPARSSCQALVMAEDGALAWTPWLGKGLRLTPADILGDEPKGHPAADLLQELADVAQHNPRPWEEFEILNAHEHVWNPPIALTGLALALQTSAHVRRRPRTKRIGQFDVPLPVREPLEERTLYYVAEPSAEQYYYTYRWIGDSTDYLHLEHGLIHLDPESAETHGRALASLMQEGEG